MKKLLLAACILSAAAAAPVLAANATRPHANCDRRLDNCGPTGDNITDQLNAQQLGGSTTPPAPSQSGPTSAPMTGAQR